MGCVSSKTQERLERQERLELQRRQEAIEMFLEGLGREVSMLIEELGE